jgi:hypothetical protein
LWRTPKNDKTSHETTPQAGSTAGTLGDQAYALSPIGQRGHDWIINAELFAELRHAKVRNLLATSIEEKLAIVAGNYAEYESELLDGAMRQVLRSDFSSRGRHQGRLAITRRLVNLLSAARMYVDQVKSDLSEFDPTGELATV